MYALGKGADAASLSLSHILGHPHTPTIHCCWQQSMCMINGIDEIVWLIRNVCAQNTHTQWDEWEKAKMFERTNGQRMQLRCNSIITETDNCWIALPEMDNIHTHTGERVDRDAMIFQTILINRFSFNSNFVTANRTVTILLRYISSFDESAISTFFSFFLFSISMCSGKWMVNLDCLATANTHASE